MAISVVLTFNSTTYDVSDYVIRHSIEVDEYLFNADNLKPNTNQCTFTLSRSCPYIDELFAWTGDVEVAISNDGADAFTGYLTDNYALKITNRGAGDIALSAEDAGIKKLKTAWVSTDALVTIFAGTKVCDAGDTSHSFAHILAGLAGVTLSSSLPTISDALYFSVRDADKKTYWDILESVLYDYLYTFYFDASGKLCLFYYGDLTGSTTNYVATNSTILQKSEGDAGIEVKKRLIQYKEVVVKFNEATTLTTATVFRDTSGQGTTDCDISIAAGGYYPSGADASTYAYIDYFLEDGRDILAVASITADIQVDSGITYELTNLGKSAQIRFYNSAVTAKHIRRLKIIGTNVIAVTADSKVTSTAAGGKKLEYEAQYVTDKTDAQALANLLRYFYANSGSTYSFRSYAGTLYPSATLFPSTTLYPLGDILALGELVRVHDPVWTGLDVNVGIYRKKYTVGKAGAQYDAIGIGTINLSDTVMHYPVAVPELAPIMSIPDTKSAISAYSPQYLGAYKDAEPTVAKNGDVYLRYSETSGAANRGVFKYDGSAWNATIEPNDVVLAAQDIVQVSLILTDDGTAARYGAEAEYGITEAIDTAYIKAAIIDMLRVGDITISGLLKSPILDTIAPQTGATVNAPTPTYWPGADLVTLCAGLTEAWHEVDSASTLDGDDITHVVKGGTAETPSYQDADKVVGHTYIDFVSTIAGNVKLWITASGGYDPYAEIYKNDVSIGTLSGISETASAYSGLSLAIGDTIRIWPRNSCSLAHAWLSPAASTVGLYNDTDGAVIVIESGQYYTNSGTINIASSSYATASHDDYWKGSGLSALLVASIRRYVAVTLGGGTFNGKTCAAVYIGSTSLTLSYDSGADDSIADSGFYDYTGSIVLPDVEGKILIGNPDGEGQYELWPHNIPGSTDMIWTIRNANSGDRFTITETRAPDQASGDIEATHSLHAVHNSVDYVRDLSLHNYSGNMHSLDVFSNFTNKTLGDWKWYQQRHVTDWASSHAYSVGDMCVNDSGKVYYCTYDGTSAGSGGPTGTKCHIADNTVNWQYLGTSSANVWGSTPARIYSIDGGIALTGGKKTTGYLHGTATYDAVFQALAAAMPVLDSTIIISGAIAGNSVSYAKRTLANRVDIYYCAAGGASYYYVLANDTSSTFSAISIAW